MEKNVLVQDKEIVVPGQELASGMELLPGSNVIREGDKLISVRMGIAGVSERLVKVIPLTGKYIPKKNDFVIGKVKTMSLSGWRIDIGWAFEANLALRDATTHFIERNADLSKYYDYGDWIVTQITGVSTNGRYIDLTMKGPGLRKLGPGRMINITSSKVPRVIGKQGSMVTLIKEHTGCKISVGQNGPVWISGESPEKELLAAEAIKKIEAEAHIPGLTDRIKEFLESKK